MPESPLHLLSSSARSLLAGAIPSPCHAMPCLPIQPMSLNQGFPPGTRRRKFSFGKPAGMCVGSWELDGHTRSNPSKNNGGVFGFFCHSVSGFPLSPASPFCCRAS